MSKWKKVGKHLDKSVYISLLKAIDGFKKVNCLSSVLLLYFVNSELTEIQLDKFFNSLLQNAPLAIHFAGKNSDKYFTHILNSSLLSKNKKHTMTYLTNENKTDEWISSFFYASWPSEDRFDAWKDYKIIVIGDSSKIYSKFFNKMIEFLK